MEKKKKSKTDTVPEIYMNGTDFNGFFVPNYPFDVNECTSTAIPEVNPDNLTAPEFSEDGDWRNEHNLRA